MKKRIIYVGTLIDLAAIFEPDVEAERVYGENENQVREKRAGCESEKVLCLLPAQVYRA